MADRDVKADLARYLQFGRDTLLFKLDGLSEYDARQPLVPTGTNLLGLVKHLAMTEAGYFGLVFGRPLPDAPSRMVRPEHPTADLWARPDETREEPVALYRRVLAHSDATIGELDLDAVGTVPRWSPENAQVTLHCVLIHVATETHRHAGHADIVCELIDVAVGLWHDGDNLPEEDAAWWRAHHDRVEQAARDAGER